MKLTQGEKSVEAAYFNRDGKAYQVTTETDKEANTSKLVTKEIENQTDIWSMGEVNALTAKAVTSAAIDETVWKRKKTDETSGLVTYRGDVGDDDGAGNKTNTLFQELFDQLALCPFTTNKVGFGTFLSKAGAIFQGAAGTMSSSYSSFAFNTNTKEITVKALLYLPVTEWSGSYVDCTYTISDVGTTEHDFSQYTVA